MTKVHELCKRTRTGVHKDGAALLSLIFSKIFFSFFFRVEVPTERRVKRWGLSVQELVRDPIGRQVLETFLESEFSSENIRFWMAIQDLKYSANDQVERKAQHIYEEFLASGAPCQVCHSVIVLSSANTDH